MTDVDDDPAAMTDALRADLLKMADEELFVGHVLTSVAGWGPELETNLALSSMGQDEIGHARLLYGLVASTKPAVINTLIFEREPAAFRAAAIASVYSHDWATLLVKHLLYELADMERTAMLGDCDLQSTAALANRVRHEETFHIDFWTTWLDRTMEVPEGPERVQAAMDELWPSAKGLFSFRGGLASDDAVSAATDRWRSATNALCEPHGLKLRDGPQLMDGRDRILTEMRTVYATAPGAW